MTDHRLRLTIMPTKRVLMACPFYIRSSGGTGRKTWHTRNGA
jgi:hypothetical protein